MIKFIPKKYIISNIIRALAVICVLFSTQRAQSQSVDFDGVNDYIDGGDNSANRITGNLSVEAWVKLTSLPVPQTSATGIHAQGYSFVVSKANESSALGMAMGVSSRGQLVFYLNGDSFLSADSIIPAGTWVHLVAAVSSSKYYGYVNGVKVDSATLSAGNDPATGKSLIIGSFDASGSYWQGAIDELRIWNSTLDSAAFAPKMGEEYCSAQTGLKVYYKFNQGIVGSNNASEFELFDYSGNNQSAYLKNFALSGSTSNWVAGKSLVRAYITGVSKYIKICLPHYVLPSGKVITTTGSYYDTILSVTGCDSINLFHLSINAIPTASFSITSPAKQCLGGNAFVTSDASTISSGSLSYFYNFGDDEQSSSSANPVISYTNPGVYGVLLLVYSDSGCSDTAVRWVEVYKNPLVKFTQNDSIQCLKNNEFKFTNGTATTSPSVTAYKWDFGDGYLATNRNVKHVYDDTGLYRVVLMVKSDKGCWDSSVQMASVRPLPTASFDFTSDSVQCLKGNQFEFANNSLLGSGYYTSKWDFGGYAIDTNKNGSYQFANAGSFKVKLVVTSESGCSDSTYKWLNLEKHASPEFTINNDSQCLKTNLLAFSNTSTVPSPYTLTQTWDYGNGKTDNAVHGTEIYSAAGTFNVKLMVETNKGCKDTVAHTVVIHPQANLAISALDDSMCLKGNEFEFLNTSSVTTGSIVKNTWDFGDANTASAISPKHAYATANAGYEVKLFTETNYGCKDTTATTVMVHPQTQANFSVNAGSQCLLGNTFIFTDSSVLISGSIAKYTWNFGDTSLLQSGSSVTNNYTSSANFNVSLFTETNYGCKDTIQRIVYVRPHPVADLTVNNDSQCLKANLFSLSDVSSIGYGVLSRTWDFGDATVDTAKSVNHAYAFDSQYVVSLVAKSEFGCTDTAVVALTVHPQAVPSFTINNDSQCLKANVFNYASTSTVNGSGSASNFNYYTWSVGDGSTNQEGATQTTASRSYTSDGGYTVTLATETNYGCKDTTTSLVVVHPQAVPSFTINNDSQCLKANVFNYASTSTVNGSGSASNFNYYTWSVGDGSTNQEGATQTTASRSYTSDGSYTVTLNTETNYGCKDTTSSLVVVHPQAVPSFTINNDSQCLKANVFNYTNTSTVNGSGSASNFNYYTWSVGDGSTNQEGATQTTASRSYTSDGGYTVTLATETNYGCKDTTSSLVVVHPQAVASFTINNDSQCLKANVFNYASTSTVNGSGSSSNFNYYTWSVGDGSTNQEGATQTTASRSYTSDGGYTVTLATETNYGCKDTISSLVVVHPQAVPSFTINNDSQCLKANVFNYTNTSTIAYTSIAKTNFTFGDFNNFASAGKVNATHNYNAHGKYTVVLYTETQYGCLDTSISQEVLVHPQTSPDFTINNDSQCNKNNEFVFSNTSNVVLGNVAKTTYDFGDNVIASGFGLYDGKHKYTYAGTYTIKQFTVTNFNCKDTTSAFVAVHPQPKPIIAAQKWEICYGTDSFRLSQNGTGNSGSQFIWIVPQHAAIQAEKANFIFSKAGEYTVKLIETSSLGCIDTVQTALQYWANPSARFAVTKVDTCLSGNLFKFKQDTISTYAITQYRWKYSDASASALSSPQKQFASTGTYDVELNVKDTHQCVATYTQNVRVYQTPSAKFDINLVNQCLKSNSFQFTNQATAGEGTITQTTWKPSSSDSLQTSSSLSYAYSVAGQKSVKMKVQNSVGCWDSVIKTVQVLSDPIVNYSVNQQQQCVNNQSFEFTNSTFVPGSTGSIGYYWSFGDTTQSTLTNPKKQYQYYGYKKVTLKATSSAGCWDTLSTWLTVQPKPLAQFTINKDTQCASTNQFAFTNTSKLVAGSWSIKNQSWDFGDGGFGSTQSSPSKKFSYFGSYKVALIVNTTFGCSDTVYKNIRVNPIPKVSYTVNNANQCLVGNNFVFGNNSSMVSGGGNLTYVWRFGNGASTTNTNPSYSYTSANTYSVKLIATSQFGCKDSITTTMKTVDNPAVNFGVNSTVQCSSTNKFIFSNTTNPKNGTGLSYTWNMNDASTSSTGINTIYGSTHAAHTFESPADYKVKLIAVNSIGCSDSTEKLVSVKPLPKSDFDINAVNQCLGVNQFKFTNQSTISAAGGTLSYQWIFADTSTANTTDVSKKFYVVKTYPVKLIASTSYGCKDSVTKNVTVRPKPAASFIVNQAQQCLNENSFVFTNTSNVSVGTLKYQWVFGDATGSVLESPKKTYNVYGTYNVKLKAITDFGCEDSNQLQMTVFSKPVAAFAVSDTGKCLYKNEFSFTNQTTNADGSAITYRWWFGDNKTSTLTSPKKSYDREGDYPIRLAAQSIHGCIDSTSKLIRVFPQPSPNFIINNPAQCLTNNSFKANNFSYVGTNGGKLSYHWTFGDGSSKDSISPSWKYSKHDTFMVKLVVASTYGCKDSLQNKVVVYPQPTVDFGISKSVQCFNGNQFAFNNLSSIPSGILSYQWNFGNKLTAVNPSPTISYAEFGEYEVELFVRSNFGCMDSLTKPVTVNASPKAAMLVNKDLQCLKNNQFATQNYSTLDQGTMSYQWNFGDGNQSTLNSPIHTFATFGVYPIKLITQTNKGCLDSAMAIWTVKPDPVANFLINDSSQCASYNDYIFLNQSQIAQGKFGSYWSFGDKNQYIGLHARHSYNLQNVYSVKLKVSSAWGCTDSMIKQVFVRNQPIVDYNFDKSGDCERTNIFVSSNRSRVNDDTLYHRWYMGDSTEYSMKDITHSYKKSGVYTVKLLVFSNYGCADSVNTKLTVYPQGKSRVEIYDTAVCFRNNYVTMGNFSRVDKDAFLFQSWNFGDDKIDTTLTVVPVSHSYPDTGTYKVTLITTTQNFCVDTSYDFIAVKPMPEVGIGNTGSSFCLNSQNFNFQSLTVGIKEGVTDYWTFGDGTSDAGNIVQHTYRLPGKYKVQLISTSQYGCSDTGQIPVTVNALPISAFTINNLEQCRESNNFHFRNTSQQIGTGATTLWDLGDGNTSGADTIQHVFAYAGQYKVQLVMLDKNGCSDTNSKVVTVHPTPFANITVDAECLGSTSQFQSNANVSDGSIRTYRWNLADGSVSGDVNPSYRYVTAGNYKVNLRVISSQGCLFDTFATADVYENPVAKIYSAQRLVSKSATDSMYEDGLATINNPEYQFTDEQLNFDYTYEWDFGDNSTPSYEMTPSHRYGDTGTYYVSLAVTNTYGCMDYDQLTVQVLPDHYLLLPSAFSPNNDGHNDVWQALGRFHSIRDFILTVHDANGILVFQTNDINEAWNGKFLNNGEDVSAGLYEVNIAFSDVYKKRFVYQKRVTVVK